MLPTRDRAKMREKARRATEEEKDNVRLTMDGRFVHDGTGIMNDFDELPNELFKLEEVYKQFKTPGRTHSERGAAIDILDDLFIRKGEEMIRSLINENKLKPFCTNLLRDLRDESNNGVKNKICRFIGHVAEKRNDSLPDLHRFIRTSLSSNKSHKQTALQLIGNSESPVYEWAIVKDLIVENILSSDSSLREPAMKALGKFANQVNDNQEMMEIMERLVPIILQRAESDCSLTDCDYEHITAFICLYEMACEAPKLLRNHVENIFVMCTKTIIDQIICENRDNRLLALQMMTCMSEKYGPSVPLHLIPHIATSCHHAIANNLGICKTDQWVFFNPAKDDEKKGEDWAITIGIVYVEKIATAIGKKRMGSHLVTVSQQFLLDEHWEKRAAALIGWASVGDSFRRGRVLTLVDWAIGAFNDTHPRVRYASLYLLGRVFCSFNINDHPNRLEKVFSSLISTLSDPIPRMVTIAAADLSELMRQCSKEYLSPYYDNLLPLLISIISRSPKGGSGNMNIPGSAFESISYLAVAVGKDRFIHDFPKVVSVIGPYLKSLVPIDSSDKTPALLSRTLLLSSERICLLLGTESFPLFNLFIHNMDKKKDGLRVLASLFQAIQTEILDDSVPIQEKGRLIPFFKDLCSFAGEHEMLTKEEIASTLRVLDLVKKRYP